jgi:hypothetical protein
MINETELKSMARAYTKKGIEVLGGYINSDTVDPELKIKAIGMMWDRGWGKPASVVEHTGKDGAEDFKITIRTILEGKK